MRNLKRALSMGLASTMVAGMMATGAGAASFNDFTDKDEIVHKEAVAMVTELGVIAGVPGGGYDPASNIDRASFARLCCVVLNGGVEPVLGADVKSTFTDTQGHWAEAYIAYCVQQGIVAGRGNNTFAPGDNVTGSAAAKMLLVALGYNTQYENIGGAGWQLTTDTLANSVGLYDELENMNTSEPITRDQAAQMIYNALNADTVKYEMVTGISPNGQVTVTPQRVFVTRLAGGTTRNVSLLEDKFKAVKVEGIVVANDYADLGARNTDKDRDTKGGVVGSALDSGRTKILVTNGEDQGAYADNREYTFVTQTEADQLGRGVYFFVKPDSTSLKSKVLGSVITSDDNKEFSDYSGDTINKMADKNNLDITPDTKVAENYASLRTLDAALAAKSGTTGVEKILIDTDNDGDVDYVLLNTAELGKVTKYSEKDDGSITVARAGGKTFTADDKDDVVGFEDVARDSVVLTSYIGGRLYVEEAESVTGTVDAYKLKEVNGDKTDYVGTAKGSYTSNLTVDGTNYTVSFAPTYTDSADFFAASDPGDKGIIGSDATFYLDSQGYIVARTEVDEAAYQYAYVWGAEAGGSIGTDRVKVTLADGTTKTYELDNKSDIDVVGGDTDTTNFLVNEEDMRGLIFSYTVNKSGAIKLMLPKGGAVETADGSFPEHDKGMTAVKLTSSNADQVDILTAKDLRGAGTDKTPELRTYYANNSSVFFYVNTKANGEIDKVSVYVGRSNAPSVDGTKGSALLALNSKFDIGAVALTDTSAKEEAGDHLFVYNSGYVTSDYINVGAILNGETEGKDIHVSRYLGSDVTNNTVVKDGLYLYTVDTNGDYELTSPAGNSFYVTGSVKRQPIKDTLVLDGGTGEEYKITDKSVIIDNTSNPNPTDGILGGAVNLNDDVWMLVNSSDEILMAYYVTPDEKGGDGHAEYDPTVAISGSSLNVRYYYGDGMPSNAKIAELVREKYDDVDRVSIRGGKVIISYSDGFTDELTINGVPLASVTYNGKDAGFLANGETLKITDQANSTLLAKSGTTYSAATSIGSSTAAGTAFTLVATVNNSTKDIVLYDGYGYTNNVGTVSVKNGDTPYASGTTSYVPSGTVLSVAASADQTISAAYNGETKEINKTTTAVDFTMPAYNVTFSQAATPTAATVTFQKKAAMAGEAAYASGVYTAQDGTKFDITCTGVTNVGDEATITVKPQKAPAADVTITLEVSGGAKIGDAELKAGSTNAFTMYYTTAAASTTIDISDDTTPAPTAITVTVTNGDANNKLTLVGGGDVANADTTSTYSVTAEASKMVKVGSNYYENGDTIPAQASDFSAEFMDKPTVTVAATAVTKNGVTATPTAIAQTAKMPGDTVTVTVTLSGTASGNAVFSFADLTGTYAVGTLSGTAGTDYVLDANTSVTVKDSKTATGTFTFEFEIGATSVAPALAQ